MANTQTVTVMFTDLVGSTELSSRLNPDEADRLRDTHFALLREAITTHGGAEVKNLGDGLMAVFPIASGALNGAEAVQQAIDRHNRTAPETLAVRIGLSHGEASEQDGDFFGDAVVEAARLCAAAQGGQILASHLVQLTAGRRAGQTFMSVGDLELKGLPDPLPTMEVQWAKEADVPQGTRVPLPQRCTVLPVTGVVGRATERATLDAALKAVTTERHARVVLMGGEPGMGKTTLATDVARAAWDDGATVLFGRCDEDLAIPYGAWAEAVKHLVNHAGPELLGSLTTHAASLVRLAPTLAGALGAHDTEPAGDAESARYTLYNAVTATLREASGSSPVVVVLDDLQWADAQTLQLLRHVLLSSDPVPALIVGTFRESDVGVGTPLADLLGTLHREEGVERISLRGLGDAELLELMESAAGQQLNEDGIALRDALLAETDGNPFFAGELLRHLVECGAIYQNQGQWIASDDLRTQGLPVSVREVVGQRVARLGEEGTRILSVASVIGRDFELGLLAAAADVREDGLLDLLDTAVDATLVENVGGTRYTFVHALIEHTLYDSLTPARRARLHRTVAESIEAQSRGNTSGHTAALAYHWSQATAPEDYEKALHYACAAGAEALQRLAPSEALRSYAQALELLDRQGGDEARRCQILIGLGHAQSQTGDASYRESFLTAANIARGLGDTEALVEAALANTRGIYSQLGVIDRERVEVLEAANDALANEYSARKARLLMVLASELTPLSGTERPRARALAEEAIAMARDFDPQTLAMALFRFYVSFYRSKEYEHYRAIADEVYELNPRLGDDDPLLKLCCYRTGFGRMFEGGLQAATAAHALEDDYVLRHPNDPRLRWFHSWGRVAIDCMAGDFGRAEQATAESFGIGTAIGEPDAWFIYGAQIGLIWAAQGRGEALVGVLEQITGELDIAGYRALLGLVYCDLDRFDDARAVMEPYASERFSNVSDDFLWLHTLGQFAYVAWHVRSVETSGLLFEELWPFKDQLAYIAIGGLGAIGTYAGMAADVIGKRAEAEQCFAAAQAVAEPSGAKWSLALNHYAWGASLLSWDQPDDRGRAVALLQAALESSRAHGYRLIERRAREALESLGEGA